LDEGAKEPIIADVSAFRVYPSRNGLPEESPVWLFLRRSSDGQIKFALSNAPEDIPFTTTSSPTNNRKIFNSGWLSYAEERGE